MKGEHQMLAKNKRKLLFAIACFLLSACIWIKAKSVQSITGLPQGTDGYAWWNDTVFYEIFVRSFYDSDGNGIGDFNGIVEKLDYLNDGNPQTTTDLGITGIWLMPINPAASYHGYDPTDYYTVNPDYGTMDDFNRLLQECHKRGIRVIIDMVYNHTSNKHPWFIESRDQPESTKRDWYVWSSTNPGYQGPWGEQVWYSTVSGYYYAIFWIGQPDLNYTDQAVSDEMYNVARFWLQDIGVDGFRLDAVRYLIEDGKDQQDTPETLAWWAGFRTFYKGINPQAMTVGEVYTTNYVVENYLKDNDFDQAFDFDLASQILKNIDSRNAVNLNASIKSSFQLLPKGEYATFLSNHDQERVMSYFSGDLIKAKLAASVLLTIPGTPFVYYGEEIGMTGNKPDERIRTPMLWSSDRYAGFSTVIPWEATNTDYTQSNVAAETSDPNSLLSLYRNLIQLRNNHAALRVGDYYTVRSDNFSIMPFLRVSKEEILLVLLNMSEKPVNGFSLTLDQGPLKGSYNAFMVMGEGKVNSFQANNQGGFSGYQPISEIPANGLVIIQLR
jgi:alpha-amylase